MPNIPPPKRGFNIFTYADDVKFSRAGKKVTVRGVDNTSADSDSVEANLLYEILKTLRKER